MNFPKELWIVAILSNGVVLMGLWLRSVTVTGCGLALLATIIAAWWEIKKAAK